MLLVIPIFFSYQFFLFHTNFSFPLGTHWVYEIMKMIQSQSAEPHETTKVQYMIDFVDQAVLKKMESPRILNTHLPMSCMPVKEMVKRKIKVSGLRPEPLGHRGPPYL